MGTRYIFERLIFCLICGLFFSHVAHGSLGQGEDSISADKARISAPMHQSIDVGPYTVHEISSKKMLIKEYLSKSGIIFGLSWKGTHHPDLEPLLGSYFADYSRQLKNSQKRLTRGSHSVVKGATIVVEKSGYPGALSGRAYISNLIPAGVNANEIK